MITEDYVSFETAKLLKEKGFDADCHAYYIAYANGTNRFNISAAYPYGYNFNDDEDYQYSAPTLQIVMKWLREVYNTVIVITPSMFWGKYNVSIYKKYNEYILLYNIKYNKYFQI